jgi:drug/metabolite transporter (DMT)-like permease
MSGLTLTHRRAVLLMVAVTLMWSIAGVVTRQLEHAKSFAVTFWRSFFTAVSLLIILPMWQGKAVFRKMHWGSGAFWISGVCWSVMFTAFMMALTLTTVGNVLVTMAVGPLLTALMARLFIGHKLPQRTWVAIGVAGAGIAYMFGAQMNMGAPGALIGCLVALLVPIAAATHWTVVQRGHMQHAQSGKGVEEQIDLVPCVLVGAVISSFVTLPLAFPFVASAKDVAWLGMLGLVQLAIPCTLSVICARVLKAPEVSLLALLEVIFGIALAWLGANEVPGPTVLLGGALVIGALLVNEILGWREKA